MPGELTARVGKKIRAERKKRGLSLQGLGERLGMSYSRLGELERGESPLNLDHLEAMAREFGMRPEELLGVEPSDHRVPASVAARLMDAVARRDRRALLEAVGELVEEWARK